jgi:hypothetical protein
MRCTSATFEAEQQRLTNARVGSGSGVVLSEWLLGRVTVPFPHAIGIEIARDAAGKQFQN